MRAMLCGCRRRLNASDEAELYAKVLEHLRREHGMRRVDPESIREAVAGKSYRYECVKLPAEDTEFVEEYGPEPY